MRQKSNNKRNPGWPTNLLITHRAIIQINFSNIAYTPMIGTRLGSYEIRAELGRGGMATVYRAYQPAVDRDVAIKVIHAASLHDPAMLDRFRREARLIARLEHPHILPIYDFDGLNAPPYIVMRYLDRGTLRDLLNSRPLPLPEAARLLAQVAAALDYAHQQGIVHRDIKPSNILLDRHGTLFVSDFGIARTIAAAQNEGPITSNGAIVGTPDYMAPEQAMGRLDVDGRADVYALGVLVFQLLTGQPPYQADQPMGVVLQHLQAPIPAPRERNPTLPPAADDLIRNALAKDPAARYRTAGELANAFTALAEASDGRATHPLLRQAAPTVVLAERSVLVTPTPTPTPREQQRLVTALYADAADYLELVEERLGSEKARSAVQAMVDGATAIIAAHGGTIVRQGQSDMQILWGAEHTAEDDAERALRAAIALRDLLYARSRLVQTDEDATPPLRLGLHTGPVLLHFDAAERWQATGATLAIAQRLAEQVEGEILISHETYRVVRGLFTMEQGPPLRLRGRAEPLATYLVRSVQPRAFRSMARDVEGIETPLVGREAEYTRLQRAYRDMVEDGETLVVTILGEGGLGKSRLLDAFQRWLELLPDSVWLLQARASAEQSRRPYGLVRELVLFRFAILDNDPLPLVRAKLELGIEQLLGTRDDEMAQLIGQLAGFDLGDAPHVRALLGDGPQLINRARQLFGRFVARLCARSPLVWQIEDLHLADAESVELFSNLLRDQPAQRLLLLATARPVLGERHPSWGEGFHGYTTLRLGPLDRSVSRELARALLAKVAEAPKTLRDMLVERSGGNPLFMEELLRMLLDDRVIRKESAEEWRLEEGRLGKLRVPTTLAGLLQARLDSLLAPERLLLQRAAVMGNAFFDTALQAIDGALRQAQGTAYAEQQINLASTLNGLLARGFIERKPTSAFADAQEYSFRESLLRDLIYHGLLDRQRQGYHRAVAEWLQASERANEYLPLIAEHYEKAEAFAQAITALEQAGDQAMAISAFATAEGFYERAIGLWQDERRKTKDESSTEGSSSFVLRLSSLRLKRADCRYRRGYLPPARAEIEAVLTEPLDDATQTLALTLLGIVCNYMGETSVAQSALEAALLLAREGTDRAILARVFNGLGLAYQHQGRFQEAQSYYEESLRLAQSLNALYLVLHAQSNMAWLLATAGDFDASEEILQKNYSQASAAGMDYHVMLTLGNLASLAFERDEHQKAKRFGYEALALARELGIQDAVANHLLNVAHVEINLDNQQEATSLLAEGLALAHTIDDPYNIVTGIVVHGYLAAARGHTERALALWSLADTHPIGSDPNSQALALKRRSLALNLDEATVAARLAQGSTLDFEQTVRELLGEG
jgi:serine/threonine protein kinase/tetratricopeptide (TPR) repeat protein